MTDPTPRLRKLRSTGGVVAYHPCTHVMPDGSYCCKEAPYGYNVSRTSVGRWIRDAKRPKAAPEWRGEEAKVEWGQWRCWEHRF